MDSALEVFVAITASGGTVAALAKFAWNQYSKQLSKRIEALEKHRDELSEICNNLQLQKDEMAKDMLLTMHDVLATLDSLPAAVTKEHIATRRHVKDHAYMTIRKLGGDVGNGRIPV